MYELTHLDLIFLVGDFVLVTLLYFFLYVKMLFEKDDKRRRSAESQKYFLRVTVENIEKETDVSGPP